MFYHGIIMACINQTKESFIRNVCEFSLYTKNKEKSNKQILEYLVHKNRRSVALSFQGCSQRP